jgi:hypothetical protein
LTNGIGKARWGLAPGPLWGPAIKTLQVSAAGQSALFTCDTQYTAWNWAAKTWTFTANSSTTDLRFTSLSGSGYNRAGPALDNVSVSPIPEPSTIGLAATAAAGLAWLAWRRKRNA